MRMTFSIDLEKISRTANAGIVILCGMFAALGYLVAEGSLSQRNRIQFTNKDQEVANEYTRILIIRNGDLIESLEGSAQGFSDPNLEPGVYEYGVIGVIGNRRSPTSECRVVVEGPSPRNVLYFSSGTFAPNEIDGTPVAVDTQVRGHRAWLSSSSRRRRDVSRAVRRRDRQRRNGRWERCRPDT